MQDIIINGMLRKVKAGMDRETVASNLQAKGYMVQIPTCKAPSIKTCHKWLIDGIAKATDGCKVEPDGSCIHGHKSWLLVLNII